ncbi:FtsX-like permease family protein [Actinoallomurus spadix]|nr:FtsX-like permease family protein [Actinoallomurus spadix]MCO5988123.1 FtsX-like permease family protein [Actinoallomurus spadix]
MSLLLARGRLGALVAIVCAVLGGSAFLTATGVLAESGLRSHLPVERLAGADVVVAARQSVAQDEDLPEPLPERAAVPARLVASLGALPGVASAIGDVSLPAAVVGPGGAVVGAGDPRTAGHGWSSRTLPGPGSLHGTPPAGPGDVALDAATAARAGVRPGDRVTVVAAGRRNGYRVSAVVGGPAGVYFDDAVAASLAGRDAGPKRGTVDLVALRAAPGTDPGALAARVRSALRADGRGDLTVAAGGARGDVEQPGGMTGRALLFALAGSIAGVVLMIVGFVVAGALSVAIAGQRRDLALLRAVGATPRQVRRLIATQTGVIALFPLPFGVALGYVLAGRFGGMLAGHGVLPGRLPLSWSPLPGLAAVLLLSAVVRVSALAAAFRTSRMPATEAVAESRAEPRTPSAVRTRIGLLLIAGAMTLGAVPLFLRTAEATVATGSASLLAVIGLGLAGPSLVRRGSGALLRRLPPRTSPATWLAVGNGHGYALRVGGAVTALGMAVAFTLSYALTQTTLMTATTHQARAATHADVAVTAPALGGVPANLAGEIRTAPGVAAVVPVGTTTVLWPHREDGANAVAAYRALVTGPDTPAVLDLGRRDGDLRRLSGATIAVSRTTAFARGAEVGDRVTVLLGDGTRATAEIVATYDRSLGFGDVVVSRDLAAGHTTTGLADRLLVRAAPGRAEVVRRSLAALTAREPGVRAGDARGAIEKAPTPPEVWVNVVVLAVLLGYVLLAVANRLAAAAAQRRDEFTALRLIGATPRQIVGMVRREAALVAAAAVGAGVALSAVPLALLGAGFLGRPWAAGPIWLLPAAAATVALIAWLATELPVRGALRAAPANVLAQRS